MSSSSSYSSSQTSVTPQDDYIDSNAEIPNEEVESAATNLADENLVIQTSSTSNYLSNPSASCSSSSSIHTSVTSQDDDIDSSDHEIPVEEIESATTNNFADERLVLLAASSSSEDYLNNKNIVASLSSKDTSFTSLENYVDSVDEIPFEDIELATNNFADENLLSQSSSSKIYKGQLMQSSSGEVINIVARTCKKIIIVGQSLIFKNLKHKNIVPLFGVTAAEPDDEDAMMIYKHEANESLDKHLSSSSTLTWMQRLKICVGIARALSYLHYDAEDDYSVIHGNIKSSKILLDHNWEPKLHGFGFAVRAKKNQLYLTDKYNGSLLYMDPAYETTPRGLTNKSDVFSFGVVLFEVLFGMEASVPTPDHTDNWYFARMARAGYEEKTLDEKIDPDLRKQMNLESLNIFSETAYFCLKEQRSQRPDTKKVLQRLERALELQYKHDQSLEHPEGTLSNHLKVKNLDHLRIPLSDIRLATDNFSDTYCIGSGGYGTVYKAKLGHFDGISSSTVTKGENKAELPEKRSTVAIKRLFHRVDEQAEKGFLAEIELLSKCKHPNIVSLIGFCNEETEMILIYEYATNGSLEDYLGNSDKITNLTWAQRIKICIDIAYGLEYLHKVTEDKECIIHRDIKSANILLDDKWEAKIADFGLSKLHPAYNQRSTLISDNIGGTQVYLDPEYEKTGRLKTSSDIYSFGVVLYEIMSGKLAYDKMYNTMGLPSLARQCVNDSTMEKLVDPQLKEADENISGLDDGLNQDSLYTFSKIASQCVAKAQVDRPTMEVIIKELEKSLNLQKNRKDSLQISLEAIKLGTQNFSDCNCTGEGRLWRLYKGKISLANANGLTTFVAKRFDSRSDEGNSQFMAELKVLFERKHKNIVGLVGYCNEMGEKIVVYEHASNGTLDKHLDDANLTWMIRLKICLDVAIGLEFLHTGGITKDTPMIHADIKSSSILLDGDWRAKLSNLELSSTVIELKKIEHIDEDNAYESMGYVDPYYKEGYASQKLDIYALGVVLLEMLCGRSACGEEFKSHYDSLVTLPKWLMEKRELNEMIFEGIKEQILPRSLNVYILIAFRCLQEDRSNTRPTARMLVEQLKLAFEYQEDYEMWEPKLPKDYEKLCEKSKTFRFSGKDIFRRDPRRHHYIPGKIKDFYDLLCGGFLFQEGKAWFSLGSNGKRNVMISAKKFSYTNRWQRKWRSIPESRFQVAAKMLDISNLKIQIKIKPELLLPGVKYGVHLVFKLRKPRKYLAKRMYVNLKYKRGSDNLNADFATWREDWWMTIELCQILNYEEDTEFEVVLESFSRCYCGSRSVYIQGIEFQTIDNASFRLKAECDQDGSEEIEKSEETHEYGDIKKLKEVQQVLKSCSNMDKANQSPVDSKEILNSHGNDEEFLLKELQNEKICFKLSALESPCHSEIGKPFRLNYSEWRFRGEIELLKQQVFGIKGKIKSQMLSPDTDYMCYLVFKLSEKCHGLHSPVKVRNVLQWKNKEIGLICFRPPSPWNLPDTNGVPKERDDGWMEVIVWKFNSNSELRNNCIPMNLKFITYEGTMSGLIVSGLEIRRM